MADTGVVDLNAHFVGLGRCDLDIFDAEILAGLPGHRGLDYINIGAAELHNRSIPCK
jgi:hypothetical protein